MPNLITNCPICFSEGSCKLYDVTPQEAAQHFILKEDNRQRNQDLAAHISKLWGGRNCSIRQCCDCEFCFSDPYVAGDVTFYDLAYERAGYPSDKWDFRRTIRELSSTNFRAKRVLEVGAGFGFFLDKIVDTYVPRSGITALEYGNEPIKVLHSKGYSTRQEDLRSANLAEGFCAIFLFQVVEHMDDLDNLFARLSQLLYKDGLLFITVPNPKRIRFNEQNGSLLDMPPNHIGGWSPAAFQTIGSRHGLRVDRHEIEPFSLLGFIKQDIGSSYLRRAQQMGTVENWSRSIRSARHGKLVGVAVAALTAPRRLNVWRKAASTGAEIGGCHWVKFTKTA